jgi:hypothetical protein
MFGLLSIGSLDTARVADNLNDLHQYDPETRTWTEIFQSVFNFQLLPRNAHGFTSAGGKLFVQGGWSGSGAIFHTLTQPNS